MLWQARLIARDGYVHDVVGWAFHEFPLERRSSGTTGLYQGWVVRCGRRGMGRCGSTAVGADWEQWDVLNGAELLSTSCYGTIMMWGVSVSAGQGSLGFTLTR